MMPSRTALGLTGALVLGLAAIIFAAVAMARVNELSLPLPASLPALNLLIPIVTAIAWPSARKTVRSVQKHALRLALPYLASASTFAPFILLILSLVYSIPSDIQSCAADQHWLRMFEDKDSRSIRSIQARLQCCGFNSMHDRAWPFPSHDADARTCERTQGYTIACGTTWRQEESLAAALCAVASFLNWLAMVRPWVIMLPCNNTYILTGHRCGHLPTG